MSKAIVFFADGFEECEGLLVVDLLRRAGVDVKTASINGSTKILSSHGITLFADLRAEDADYAAADIVILPGGLKGTENLAASTFVKEKCLEFANEKKWLPSVLLQVSLPRSDCLREENRPSILILKTKCLMQN